MLAWFERTAKEVFTDYSTDPAFPAESFQIKEIVFKDWLAVLQEESEASAEGYNHCRIPPAPGFNGTTVQGGGRKGGSDETSILPFAQA